VAIEVLNWLKYLEKKENKMDDKGVKKIVKSLSPHWLQIFSYLISNNARWHPWSEDGWNDNEVYDFERIASRVEFGIEFVPLDSIILRIIKVHKNDHSNIVYHRFENDKIAFPVLQEMLLDNLDPLLILRRMTQLTLDHILIKDPRAIGQLTDLKSLSLDVSPIMDLSFLSKLKKLNTLTLFNPFRREEYDQWMRYHEQLEVLLELGNLKYLTLSGEWNMKFLDFLSDKNSITDLHVNHEMDDEELVYLSKFKHVQRLKIKYKLDRNIGEFTSQYFSDWYDLFSLEITNYSGEYPHMSRVDELELHYNLLFISIGYDEDKTDWLDIIYLDQLNSFKRN
jgi:hypothetical protein